MSVPTHLKLNHGGKDLPIVGLGTWKAENGVVGKAIEAAIDAGYRHFDCAAVYGNEEEVGEAFKKVFASGKVKREDVFIVSKLWCTNHDHVREACEKTLKDLQMDYVDLYLMHWPVTFVYQGIPPKENVPRDESGYIRFGNTPISTVWKDMEKLVDDGLVKAIGVSNFKIITLLDLLKTARIRPATNQIEVHPYHVRKGLLDFCKKHDIVVTAYAPMGSGKQGPLQDPLIHQMAQKYKKTEAQVLIRWSMQMGMNPIPKSSRPERVAENINVFDFELSQDDVNAISALDKNLCLCDPMDTWQFPTWD